MRAVLVGLLAAAVIAAPAAALEPPPQIFTWDTFPIPGVTVDECESSPVPGRVASGGFDGGTYLTDANCPRPFLQFAQPQALVKLYVRAPVGGPQLVVEACGTDFCDPAPIDSVTLAAPVPDWRPVTVRDPAGAATIITVIIDGVSAPVDLDDVAISTSLAQPDAEIGSGPPASTGARDATFTFAANQPLVRFDCALDGNPIAGCASPLTLPGLATGPHRLIVTAVDRWGGSDATPAAYDWTIVADADLDGVLDAADNCPGTANATQADADADGIGDACETLPAGNVPPVAGENVIASDVRGDVFVKLPPGARPATTRTRFQDAGFQPIKGVASLPVGSTVDARKGSLAIQAAANSRPAADRRRRAHRARLAAGIFRIRQSRNRKKPGRPIPTDAVLVSGERAERACAGSTRRRPLKGIVRSLTMSGKGFFRAVGGASVGTARDATFITTDRCDGTLTEVGRGKVQLRDRRRKRGVTVRAGRGYLIKRPQFLTIKGQPNRAERAPRTARRYGAEGIATSSAPATVTGSTVAVRRASRTSSRRESRESP